MIDLIKFSRGGMDQDNSRDSDKRDPNDYDEAFNFRTSGTSAGEGGNGTNYESHVKVSGPRPAGFNKTIGGRSFEHIRRAYSFIYNTNGNDLIVEFDHDTETETILYTDLTDSGGVDALRLNPARYVTEVQLVDNTFLIFIDSEKRVCMINIEKLRNKEYGIIQYDDFSLLKPQPMLPVLPEYGDDSSRSVNLLRQGLYQFISQFIYGDYQYSAWSMMSKRVVPVYESTTGTDVTKSNYLKVSVHVGNDRVEEISVGARTGEYTWYEVKRISRKKVLAITNTAIDVARGIYEAYEPNTGYYTFAFYNDGNYNAIPALETDLLNDVVPEEAGTMEVINSTLIALSDLKEGKVRPEVDVDFSVSTYDSGLSYNEVENPDALKVTWSQERKGGNQFYQQVYIWFAGKVKTGDKAHLEVMDYNDKTSIQHEYNIEAVVGENDNTLKFVQRLATMIQYASVRTETDGRIRLTFSLHRVSEHNQKVEVFKDIKISLANAGDGSSTSKPSLKTGSAYQGALAYYDQYGRPFPINTDSSFIVRTPTYAELKGKAPRIDWKINSEAPAGAKYYNILLSQNNTHEKTLFVTGKESGSAADYVILYINPLKKFNENNQASVLEYGFSKGDRATLHYMEDGANVKTWFDGTAHKAIDVEVLSFEPVKEDDPSEVINYQLKIRKSADLVLADIQNKDIMVEIYTPRRRDTVNQDGDTLITTPFFETGDRFAIVDGKHSVTSGSITEGDVYLKTRPYVGAVDPNSLFNVIVEDFHFSDYYASNFYSYGRVRTYFDTPEEVYLGAHIRYGEVFEKGSRINGLNRFYLENIYGDGPGETSSSYGKVKKMEQRGGYLVVLQEINNGHVPVYKSILEDEEGRQNVAVSTRLFGSIRYNQAGNVGIGEEQTAYARSHNGTIYFADPNNSMPMRDGFDGLKPIPGKMSKYFQQVLHNAFRANKKVIFYYNDFQKELIITLENDNDVLFSVSMDINNVEILEDFAAPTALGITILTQPAKGTVTYNPATGKAVYQSNAGATGTDNFTYQFTVDGIVITKRACINIQAGDTTVDQFQFIDVYNQELSTQVTSNGVLISGNNVPVAYTIVGGEIQINGGAWTNANGVLHEDDFVVLRGVSSSAYETDHAVTLNVGGFSDSFNIVTKEAPAVPVNYELREGDSADFLDNNINFFINDNPTRSAGVYNESTGTFSNGVAGDTVHVNQDYYGGATDPDGNVVTAWPYPVTSHLVLLVNGVESIHKSAPFPANQAVGNLQNLSFVLEVGKTYLVRSYQLATPDSVPDGYTLTDVTNAEINTSTQSNLVTVNGINMATNVSVTGDTGAEYQKNGGAWTNAAGTVVNGDTIRVRTTSSGSYVTAKNVILNIGGVIDTFTVTTKTQPVVVLRTENQSITYQTSLQNSYQLPGSSNLEANYIASPAGNLERQVTPMAGNYTVADRKTDSGLSTGKSLSIFRYKNEVEVDKNAIVLTTPATKVLTFVAGDVLRSVIRDIRTLDVSPSGQNWVTAGASPIWLRVLFPNAFFAGQAYRQIVGSGGSGQNGVIVANTADLNLPFTFDGEVTIEMTGAQEYNSPYQLVVSHVEYGPTPAVTTTIMNIYRLPIGNSGVVTHPFTLPLNLPMPSGRHQLNVTLLKSYFVTVNYSVNYGLNPITHNALIFMRNGVEVHRTGAEGSGSLVGIFMQNDVIRVRQFTYGPAFPWEANSNANLNIVQNAVTKYNGDIAVQDVELQYGEFILNNANAVTVTSTGSSTAVGYITKVLNVTTNTQQAKITITDTTVPKTVLILDNSLQNSGGVQVFPYNLFNDANPQTMLVENISGTNPMDVTVNGGSVVNIPAGGSQSFTGINKDSIDLNINQI